jgi:hypothetical protein
LSTNSFESPIVRAGSLPVGFLPDPGRGPRRERIAFFILKYDCFHAPKTSGSPFGCGGCAEWSGKRALRFYGRVSDRLFELGGTEAL